MKLDSGADTDLWRTSESTSYKKRCPSRDAKVLVLIPTHSTSLNRLAMPLHRIYAPPEFFTKDEKRALVDSIASM